MRPLLGRRRLERRHLAALRVQPGHDVADRAVLARRINALQHDEHRTLLFGVEPELQVRESLDVLLQRLFRLGLVPVTGRGVGIAALEFRILARFDDQLFG